ncbi:coiled-coil domain-containing protein 154 [Carlito syrichta]|uniref:Coiled-coil domain-containing protein 154 n=1 Tax=Carlito syrichta TaxID=1868482 RepID=A0A3Q0EFL5_CARSF|nr:coiled-coil domain-containing protein 154 [Carlito syrichta]
MTWVLSSRTPGGARARRAQLSRHLLVELAESSPSSGASPTSQSSTVPLDTLGPLLVGGLASPEPLSLEEISVRYESGHLASTASIPEQDTAKRWDQLEQWVADLQAEVASLRRHKERCELATLRLLRELLQVRAHVQLQQAAPVPEKEVPELFGPPNQTQMQALDKRLVEVREALTQIRRKQALQDSERKGAEQEASLRLTKLTDLLRQEEQGREAACSALQKSQEDTSQRVDREVARMQAQVTKLGEEVSLRFLRREAKLCGFLQKSFQALEKRMKASEGSRLRLEGSLREHVLEQCRGLDAAVAQLTKFVQQNQVSLNRVLLAEQEARDAKGRLEESQTGELAAYVQENLEAIQLASELARQETHGELALLREKTQVLEASVAQLAGQLKDLSDHLPALSCRLDLQEQVLGLRLSEAKTEWEGAERRSLGDLAQWQQEIAAHLRGVWEKVDSLPKQIEGVSDKCVLHKSDSDLRISAEGKTREFEVGALRQELATLLSTVQLLKEDQPGRKIAEVQGKLATFQNQIMKLESSMQAHRTIQNLKFNTEAKLRTQETATLWENTLHLGHEETPWARALALGRRKACTSLERPRCFIKDTDPGNMVPVNRWGVYQAVRWLQWKAVFVNLVAPRRPGRVPEKSHGWEPTRQRTPRPLSQK